MKEVEERKAKIRKEKHVIKIGKTRTLETHKKEIKDLVEELKQESKQRVQ